MKNSKNVVGYVRTKVMGPEGNEKIKNQIGNIYSYCELNNIQINQVFCDFGVSGLATGDGLKELINQSGSNSFQEYRMIIQNETVLGRDMAKVMYYHRILSKKKLQVEIVNQSSDSIAKDKNILELWEKLFKS